MMEKKSTSVENKSHTGNHQTTLTQMIAVTPEMNNDEAEFNKFKCHYGTLSFLYRLIQANYATFGCAQLGDFLIGMANQIGHLEYMDGGWTGGIFMMFGSVR